jgi:signal transduction histidine kinase
MPVKTSKRELVDRLDRLRRRVGAQLQPGAAIASAEDKARRAEMRLREALDVLPEGIVFLDPEGRYVLWNKKYAEIYHRSADLFREGVRLADTLRIGVGRGDYPEAVGREDEWLAARLALLDNPGQSHQQRLADGRWVMIEERKTADGGVIGIRVDITDLKAQEARLEEALAQAQAANRAKGEFLANMSHEIRTPLNGVLGLAEVLARTNLDDTQRRLLKTMMSSANDLNVLLADVLDVSRLEAGKVDINPAPVAIEDLVYECAALFRANAAAKGLTLSAAVDPAARGTVMADATRIKQILSNLLSNAVKFTSDGGVDLSLTKDAAGAYRFEVRDSGVGFKPADAERLFERFEQADGSTTRQFGGAGLGLSICRQLSELMGGSIGARGIKGEGACFTVTLPLQRTTAAEQPPGGPLVRVA